MAKDQRSPNGKDIGIYTVARLFDLLEALVTYGCLPFFTWLIVKELAGYKTVVDIAVNYFAKGSNSVPWILATSTSLWAYGERKFRQRKVSQMSRHILEVESRLDPNRTTSGLTDTGQSPKRRKN